MVPHFICRLFFAMIKLKVQELYYTSPVCLSVAMTYIFDFHHAIWTLLYILSSAVNMCWLLALLVGWFYSREICFAYFMAHYTWTEENDLVLSGHSMLRAKFGGKPRLLWLLANLEGTVNIFHILLCGWKPFGTEHNNCKMPLCLWCAYDFEEFTGGSLPTVFWHTLL
jgi:hypothetical protein